MSTWLYVAYISIKIFKEAKVNHFSFSWWSVVGMMNIYHIFLSFYYTYTEYPYILDVRYAVFSILDIVMMVALITSNVKNRSLDTYIKTIFLILITLNASSQFDTYWFTTLEAIIFMYLSYTRFTGKIRLHFIGTFILYGLAMSAPYWDLSFIPREYQGITSTVSLSIGVVFSVALAYGISILIKRTKEIDK
jgi:hypothetical protein